MLTSLMLLTFIPAQSMTGTETTPPTTKTVESEEVKLIIKRLEEIKAMDKSEMSKAEKKALRKEVKKSEKRMGELRVGGYVSLGAAIIIILLLVILL